MPPHSLRWDWRWLLLGAVQLLLTVIPGVAAGKATTQIANGVLAVPGQFPWMAALFRSQLVDPAQGLYNFCGGSLIAPNVVMTAAHCVEDCHGKLNASEVAYVKVGIVWSNDSSPKYIPKNIYMHPKYDTYTLANDVALIELEGPILGAKPVKLARASTVLTPGDRLTVMGFGETPTLYLSSQLLYTDLEYVARDVCNSFMNQYDFGSKVDITTLCAATISTNNSCGGDSGGPLITQGPEAVQVGIVSYGPTVDKCGGAGGFGQYTDVRKVRPWVRNMLRRINGRKSTRLLSEGGPSTPLPPASNERPFKTSSAIARSLVETRGGKATPQISAGQTAQPNQFPFMAALYDDYPTDVQKGIRLFTYCGGSLIAPNAVLTSAQCMLDCYRKPGKIPAYIRVGMVRSKDRSAAKRKAAKAVVHPCFNKTTLENDAAIIFLDRPINSITPVKLATPGTELMLGQPLTVMGFGETLTKAVSASLLYTTVSYATLDDCRSFYRNFGLSPSFDWLRDWVPPPTALCAASIARSSACPGDEGGPLLTQGAEPLQVGIVGFFTWNQICGGAGNWGGYTDVRSMHGWIQATLAAGL